MAPFFAEVTKRGLPPVIEKASVKVKHSTRNGNRKYNAAVSPRTVWRESALLNLKVLVSEEIVASCQ